jgi:hypothetical protein
MARSAHSGLKPPYRAVKELAMGSHTTREPEPVSGLQSRALSASLETCLTPVFWIYIDNDGCWCLRKEGGAADARFSSRDAAVAFLKGLVGGSSYRLFIEAQDGRIVAEQHQTETKAAEDRTAEVSSAVENQAGACHVPDSDLRRQLDWANQLEAAARFSPSRISLLKDWLNTTGHE